MTRCLRAYRVKPWGDDAWPGVTLFVLRMSFRTEMESPLLCRLSWVLFAESER